jgi:hypothetical protein
MTAGKRNLIVALSALALLAALPAAAAGSVAAPIRAVFLKEYSKSNYTMAQGDIVVFSNEDPFLNHGVSSTPFSAATIPPGSSNLVVGAPFLHPGTYSFADPTHPEMASSLTVTPGGSPLPADAAPPHAKAKIISSGKQVARSGKVRVRVTPDEPAAVSLKARVGNKVLGKASLALPLVTRGTVSIVFDPAVTKLAGRFTLQVKGTVTDVAGHATSVRKSARLSAPKKK